MNGVELATPKDIHREVEAMADPFVAIQVGAVSFVDEGVAAVLEILQERGSVNALFLATPTWTHGTGGRQLPGHPLPDHGVQEHDLDWVGGNYATVHPQYYGGTILGPVGRAPEHPDWDIFEAVLPEAKKRGMRSIAWIEESSYADELRRYPNMPRCLEVDPRGRPVPRMCFNNPDYRNWHLSIVEDYAKSYDLDGIAWCSERPGPLNLLMQGPVSDAPMRDAVTCFCRHCQALARERGIDVCRALEGYQKALDWNALVASGDRPEDGAYVAFWRPLLQYPERSPGRRSGPTTSTRCTVTSTAWRRPASLTSRSAGTSTTTSRSVRSTERIKITPR